MELFEKLNEPIVIKNTDFKRCYLLVSFPINVVDQAKLKILRSLVFEKSNTYDTDKKIYQISVNNYCISYSGSIVSIGDNYFLELSLYFPCEDSLGEDVLDRNLEFVKEIIYNPYTINGVYSDKEIIDIKDIIKNKIDRNFKNALWYYNYKNDLFIDEDDYLCDKVVGNLSLLDEVNECNLYDYYKEIISSPPLIYLIGNVDQNKASQSIKRILLDDNIEMVKFEKKYKHFCKNIPDKPIIKKEKTNFNSSGVAITYKIRDMKEERDSDLLSMIRSLIDSNTSNMLFNKLRIENDLVYRCGSYVYSSFGSITLWASIDENNIDTCIECMKEVMEMVKDKSLIEEKVKLILEKAKLEEELDKENISTILFKCVDKYIGCTEKTFYEQLKNVNSDEIISFMDRMVLTNIYIGVGEGDE